MRVLRWTIVLICAALVVDFSARTVWHHRVDHLIAALDAQQQRPAAAPNAALPEVVARFFAAAISPDRPPVSAVNVDTAGDFLMTPDSNGWRPFHARQRFNALSPGFVWDARIEMTRFVPVFVRDAYVDGRGEMVARVLGVYAVANEAGSAELADGELMRFLAEMMWFPSALRPENGVTWTPFDDHRAIAHLTDRGHAVSLQFTFDNASAITEVFARARMRAVEGGYEPTPWAVRCSDHQDRLGFRIPIVCEAEWRLPEGPLVYWRGRVTNITFEK